MANSNSRKWLILDGVDYDDVTSLDNWVKEIKKSEVLRTLEK
jgi:hypothetical protein